MSYTRDSSNDIIVEDVYISKLSNGSETYTIKDSNAIHSEDVTSTYSPTGTDPVNGTAVKAALDEDYAMVIVDYTAS